MGIPAHVMLVEDILKSFESRVILKFDELKSSGIVGAKGTSPEDDKEVCPAPGGGRWYHQGGHYRRVPHDYIDKPTEDEAKNMYGNMAGCIISLNDNR